MIVVDTSIVIAIIRNEPERPIFINILDDSPSIMSAVSFVEAHIVANALAAHTEAEGVDSVVESLGIAVTDVTRDQAKLAVDAFLAYSKGRNSARLNIADCFSYALAKSRNAALLFKGNDFSKTDIVPAWRP